MNVAVLGQDALTAFAVTCFVIEMTPGPNMAYLALLSATDGRRAGISAVLGIALGLLVLGAGAALGLAGVISSSHALYNAMRWGGVIYLLWLAFEGWQDAVETGPDIAAAVDGQLTFFIRGLMTNLLNPKAALFYIAVLPAFLDPARPVLSQTLVMTALYVVIATAIHGTIVGLAGAARPFLSDPERTRLTRRVLSVALAGIALWFAYSTAR